MKMLISQFLVSLVIMAVDFSPVSAFELDIVVPSNELEKSVRAVSLVSAIQVQEINKNQEQTSTIEILSAAQADYRRIVELLYDTGYFGPDISITIDGREAASIEPVYAPGQINKITIRVNTGSKFKFGTVSISPKSRLAKPVKGFFKGETASIKVLRDATAAEITGWRQDGYAKAAVKVQEITARHSANALDAEIVLDPGPKLRFGVLHVNGQSTVSKKRIQEITGWQSGIIFSPDALQKVQKRLRRTGTFSASNLTEAKSPNPDKTLDFTATINDQLPRRYTFGAEYSTQEGLSLEGSWLHRNIFGQAERLLLEGSIGGIGGEVGKTDIDSLLSARLSRPATFRTDLEAYALLAFEQVEEEYYDARTAQLGIGGIYFYSIQTEYRFGLTLKAAKTNDELGTNKYTILIVPIKAIFDNRNNKLDATSGYYAAIGIEPFLNIAGTKNGVVTTADLRAYHKVGKNVTLAIRGLLGSVAGPSITKAPADYLFYSGGSGTVRGQGYQSLGVNLSEDVTVGGRSFVGLSGELRLATSGKLGIVGFYDAGYIGPESRFDSSSGEWQSGFGAGVRYATGIGPIRIDVGFPASGSSDHNKFEVYIGIGQSF
ncbi:MAG: BamA/TamA family outer membrane protein [Alphaproteobacteria bacterium]|nr:BamA/TamA family outer membrane protein [Alphaproteobacteria bacterium]